MKRILAAGSFAAIGVLGLAAPANAAPSEAACFGQVRQTVNGGGLAGLDKVRRARQGPRGPGEERGRERSLLDGGLRLHQ